MSEHRYKLFFLGAEYFSQSFNRRWSKTAMFFEYFIGGEKLPDDAEMVGVHYDFARQGFMGCFKHSSFDVVPYGEKIPCSDEPLHMEVFQVTRSDRENELLMIIDEKDREISRLRSQVSELTKKIELEENW